MLDLSQETIVPFVTKLRRRDGKIALMVSGPDTYNHRKVIATHTGDIYYVTKNGKYGDGERDDDIVAVARPWVPKDGERVEVVGYMKFNGEAFMPQKSKMYFINDEMPDANPVTLRDDEGNTFKCALAQLRKYKAPQEQEEPSDE